VHSTIDDPKVSDLFFKVTSAHNISMDSNLLDKARATVGSDHVLVNLISRRVRQLNASSRPLVEVDPGMGFIDIALKEISEGKISARAAQVSEAA
jgi:DNA-directed RNA polymerase subunit omega